MATVPPGSGAPRSGPLLTPEFLAKLEQLELVSRRILVGRLKGERRSKRKGSSVEFADHRQYVSGDDLRFIDWNILVRLDRLFIKLFEEEEDLHIHILVDVSRSMDFGEPSKLRYAQQLAASLAFIGLINMDRVRVVPFGEDLYQGLPAQRGRASLWRMMAFLESLHTEGGGNLEQACKSFVARTPPGGVVILLSDLLDKRGYQAGLRYLLAKRMDVYVIQVLAAEEVDPPVVGDLKLVDAEDGDIAEVTISAPLLARYKANLQAFLAEIRQYCTARGMAYLFTTNAYPVESVILTYLRERGLVK